LPAAFFALLIGSAQAQTVTPTSFGMNLGAPATTVQKVFAGTCRLWNASGIQAAPGAQDVSWAAVETASGVYSWTQLDTQVAQCLARGQQIIYTFGSVPGWANGNTGAYTPPTSFATLYAFQSAVVSRYKGDGIIYSAWDEANVGGGFWWNGTQAQMLAIASNLYSVVHATDPTAKVATPSVAGWGGQMFPWLQTYLAAGGGAYADAMDVHLYPYENASHSSIPATTSAEAIPNQLATFQNIFAYYGQGSKPLIGDEGGYGNMSNSGLTTAQFPPYASKWLIFNASAGLTSYSWYAYDDPSASGWGPLWDGGSGLNATGIAYRVTQSWLAGATFTSAAARVANTNQVRNPTGTGMVAGTPGTPPTNWSVYNPDSGHGITTSWVGTCASGGGVEWLVSGTATAGATGYVQLSFESGTHIAATTNQWWTFGLETQLLAGSVIPSDGTIVMEMNENNSGGTYLDLVLYYVFSPFGGTLAQNAQTFSTQATNASVAYVVPQLTVAYSAGDTLSVPLCITAPSMDTGSEYSATLTDASGNAHQIVWDSAGGPTSYSTSYTYAQDITGNQTALSGTATLTGAPLFLSNALRKGWTP
jgi:hypothetical protein